MPCTFQSSGVDWLTASAAGDDGARMFRRWERIYGDIEAHKAQVWMGYTGKYAERGAFIGQRGDRTLVRLSGDTAPDYWRDFIPLCDRISRLDIQVTVRTPEYDESVAKRLYAQAQQANTTMPHYPAHQLITSSAGDTFSLGTRTSDKYLRVYNKWAESKGDPAYINCWRYELELKAATALTLGKSLAEDTQPSHRIAQLIQEHLTIHKLHAPYPPTMPDKFPKIDRSITSDERKLDWLAAQVAPTVYKLCQKGYLIRVLDALNLIDRLTGEIRLEWTNPKEEGVLES